MTEWRHKIWWRRLHCFALHHFFSAKSGLSKRKGLQLDTNNKVNGSRSAILVISHDAYPAGAQRLLLNLLEEWRQQRRFPVRIICVADGALRKEFEQLFPTLVLSDFRALRERNKALKDFLKDPVRIIYSSTVVNGPLLSELRQLGVPVITHSHEMQASIERWAGGKIMAQTLINTDFFLAGSQAVAENLRIRHQVPPQRLDVVYDFISLWGPDRTPSTAELAAMRHEFGITESDIVVFGCGTTDWRKGPDIFLDVALQACSQNTRLKFIWIGGEAAVQNKYQESIAAHQLEERIQFVSDRPQSRRYYYIGHMFALPSREDPCPLVALEAADARLPIICFDKAGDIPRVLGSDCGAVIAFGDTAAFAVAILDLAQNSARREIAGAIGKSRVREHHSSGAAAAEIEHAIERTEKLPRNSFGSTRSSPLVSVLVPNYNHQQFLIQRLDSIAGQTLRNIEIIVMDDASTDHSVDILKAFVAGEPRAKMLCNSSNSGSTFKQWRRGMDQARGKYIWIAESDDAADYRLLDQTVARLEANPTLILAQCQSLMIDRDGRTLGKPDGWLNELAPQRWDRDYENRGVNEIREFLCKKNTILNASAVVFRNFPGIEHLVDDSMRLCADWLFWIRLLSRGDIAFLAGNLNYWRQNSSNARVRPPGILEWQEGQQVFKEIGSVLNLGFEERAELLDQFRRRCVEWAGKHSDQIRMPDHP